MHGSALGKWLIGHRLQAHLVVPGVGSLILIAFYYFGGDFLQSLVAPGFFDLPVPGDRKGTLPGILKFVCLTWTLLLAVKTAGISRDLPVKLLSGVVALTVVLILLYMLEGGALTQRIVSEWNSAGDPRGWLAEMPFNWRSVASLALVGLPSVVLFLLIPLRYGGHRDPTRPRLAPSRWMIVTVIVLFAVFWLAFKLQFQGWSADRGIEGALRGNVSVFVLLVFQYMGLLYMAELNYLTVVRREADLELLHRR